MGAGAQRNGTIAFFVIGCFAALILDRLDDTIRSEKDVRRILGIGCIGVVPRLAHLEPSGALRRILDVPTAPYTEALRSVMVSLQLLRPCQEAPKVMLITSSVPGEGKSTLAVSLAAYAARAGARVLLLDLDFSEKASGHEPYEQRLRGVMDLLAQDQLPAGTIHAADNVHLDYLPVRRGLAADPLPLFFRDHMATLLEKLRGNYDHVFIDSAPVLAKAEVRLLAAIVDSVLFVVRWGRTPGAEVRAALDMLRGSGYPGADISGRVAAVITQVDLRRHVRGRHRDQGEALAKYAGHYKKA